MASGFSATLGTEDSGKCFNVLGGLRSRSGPPLAGLSITKHVAPQRQNSDICAPFLRWLLGEYVPEM